MKTQRHPNTSPITGSESPASMLAKGTEACLLPKANPCLRRVTPSKMATLAATWIVPLPIPPRAVATGITHQAEAEAARMQATTVRELPMRKPWRGPRRATT